MLNFVKDLQYSLNSFQVKKGSHQSNERIVSIDALRGFDMFWIMGMDVAFRSLGDWYHHPVTAFLKKQMDHSEWTGFTFYDIIMPLFLFLVGISMVYSLKKRFSRGDTIASIWKHTLKRFVILWILGMMVQGNLFTYDLEKIELYSNTLQAIASGYLISTVLIIYLPVRGQIFGTLVLLFIYWLVSVFVPVNGSTLHAWDMQGNVPMYLDDLILGSFRGYWHYAWILPSLNFAATVMLGAFSGYMLQASKSGYRKFWSFIIVGTTLILFSLLLNLWQPIIKKIWTSSFVLFSGGICIGLLAFFYLLLDVWKIRKGFRWMIIIGSNSIVAYVAWHLFEHQFTGIVEVVLAGLQSWIQPAWDFLRYTGGFLSLYLILWYMYKNKTFIKI